MAKKRYPVGEIIEQLAGKSVCAGFAFSCHFLSSAVTFCQLTGDPSWLKTLESRWNDSR